MTSVTRALNIAKTKGLNAYQTATAVARASLTKLGKMIATGVASTYVSSYVTKVVEKVTESAAFSKIVGFGTATVTAYITYSTLDAFDKQYDVSGIYPKSTIRDASNVLHYYDDNGVEYRVGNKLNNNITYTVDGKTYKTDALGRKISASGNIVLNNGERKPMMDSIEAIGQGSQLAGDDRGHIIGDKLGGTNGLENMFAQDSGINRGQYRLLESQLIEAVKDGRDVKVDIKLFYEGDSHRPVKIVYKYIVDNIINSITFFN